MRTLSLTLAALAVIPLTAAEPVANPTIKEAITGGKVSVALRARTEMVDVEGISSGAIANTLRVALGYTTLAWNGLSASAQFEGVYDLGRSEYNHPLSPDPSRPTILDYYSTNELQQGWIQYAPAFAQGASIKIGRQEINFDNQRWVGNVGWRQDWQSFDAGRVDFATKDGPLSALSATYAHVTSVHRILPDESAAGVSDIDANFLNVAWKAAPFVTLVGYGYFLDYESGPIGAARSTSTVGVRASGAWAFADPWKINYTAEFAKQNDFGDNPGTVDQPYALLEAGVGWKSLGISLGYELLGGDAGDANNAVNSPLATVHAHNGWADLFAGGTPVGGLVDMYLKAGGGIPQVKGLKALVLYHVFTADDSAAAAQDLGTELDLLVEYQCVTFDPSLLFGVKYASYSADEFGADTEKLWIYSQYTF